MAMARAVLPSFAVCYDISKTSSSGSIEDRLFQGVKKSHLGRSDIWEWVFETQLSRAHCLVCQLIHGYKYLT